MKVDGSNKFITDDKSIINELNEIFDSCQRLKNIKFAR